MSKYLSLLISIVSGCSATSDPSAAGLCQLKCGGAKITDKAAKIRWLAGESASVSCDSATGLASGPVTLQFMIEKNSPSGANNTPENDKKGGALQKGYKVDGMTPLAGVAFEPLLISGLMAAAKSSPDNGTLTTKDGKSSFEPYRYTGIVTPNSEWCTDSCGVGTVEVWPACVKGKENSITFVVHSGGAYAKELVLSVSDSAAQ